MTWLLVSTSPSALITMPVPAAASLLYCNAVSMITKPGLTLVTMSRSPLARSRELSRYRREMLVNANMRRLRGYISK